MNKWQRKQNFGRSARLPQCTTWRKSKFHLTGLSCRSLRKQGLFFPCRGNPLKRARIKADYSKLPSLHFVIISRKEWRKLGLMDNTAAWGRPLYGAAEAPHLHNSNLSRKNCYFAAPRPHHPGSLYHFRGGPPFVQNKLDYKKLPQGQYPAEASHFKALCPYSLDT